MRGLDLMGLRHAFVARLHDKNSFTQRSADPRRAIALGELQCGGGGASVTLLRRGFSGRMPDGDSAPFATRVFQKVGATAAGTTSRLEVRAVNSSLREHHTASAQDDGSVVGAALGLVECLNAYEQGRRESHAPPTLPPLTLLGDREVEEFLGTLPTLTDEQLDRLLTLAQIEADKRAFDREHEDAIELPLREVA